MSTELREWLYTPCDVNDLLQIEPGIYYLPITKCREKMKYMEETFSVNISEHSFNHFMFCLPSKEVIVSAGIGVRIDCEDTVDLIGSATFNVADYGRNTHYGATVKSLAIINAFTSRYPQFGSAFMAKDNVVPEQKNKPEMDVVVKKKYLQAIAKNDTVTIQNLEAQYHVESK